LATFGVIILKTRDLLCGRTCCPEAATSVSVCNRLHALVQAAVLEYGFADERQRQRRKARRSPPLGRVRVCGGHRQRPVDTAAFAFGFGEPRPSDAFGFGGPSRAFAAFASDHRTRWPRRRDAGSPRSLSAAPAGRPRERRTGQGALWRQLPVLPWRRHARG